MNASDLLSRVLPQFFPKHWLDTSAMAYTEFPSRICVGYVLREYGAYSYVAGEEFAAIGISSDELHSAALANLACLPSASISIAKVSGGTEGWISATEDNFVAVRVLLPNVQSEFREQLGDEFFVSLPHRDDCFCWSVSQSSERQAKRAREILEQFLQDDYNLTPDILKCSPHGFQVHLDRHHA